MTTDGGRRDPADPPLEPVSTRVSRAVPAGKVAAFEKLLHEMIMAARRFAGHLGADVLRPEGGGIYQIVFRYRSRADHDAWMGSAERRQLAAQVDELLDDGGRSEVRTVDGWEGWFVTPGYAPPVPPRRWKMAVITFGALYPIVLGLILALGPLTGRWPVPAGLLLTLGLTIPLMTWLIMPALTTLLGPWLRR